jgi:hypothetical protein
MSLMHHSLPRPLVVAFGFLLASALAVGYPVFSDASTGASGESVEGTLTVSSSPSVATQIAVGSEVRNTAAIRGLPLPAGMYPVCATAPDGYLQPPCQFADVRAGEVTSLVIEFESAGRLVVNVSPAGLAPRVTIDGVPRDRGPLVLPVSAGVHVVCAEEFAGYTSVPCHSIDVPASGQVEVTFEYDLAEPDAAEPAPEASPGDAPTEPAPADDVEESEPVDQQLSIEVASFGAYDRKGPTWSAAVVLSVGYGDIPAADVEVTAVWSSGASGTCVTAADGSCSFKQVDLLNRVKEVSLQVESADGSALGGPVVTVQR